MARRQQYRVAYALGKSIVEIENMGASEFQEWLMFFNLEPTLGERIDIGNALVTSAVYRAQGGRCDASKFLPRYETHDPTLPTDDELKAKMMKIMGGVKSKS